MNKAKGSKTNTIKAVTVFSLCLLAFSALVVGLFPILGMIYFEFFYRDDSCQHLYRCLVKWGTVLLFVGFASYSYGIILGLGVLRGILRIEGNYLGAFAYGLIGAIPTLLFPVISIFVSADMYFHTRSNALLVFNFGIGFAFALVVAAAAGFGYFKEGWGSSSWIRVLGIVSGVFFLIIGITFLFSSIRGYILYF